MQDDLTWGVKHLVDLGIADPKRVGIMGGSYGGYAALAGAAFTPDLFAAAVSLVGPSNLLTLLESLPPYWEAGRIIFHERLGNPATPEGRRQLERQSPLASAAKIRTPLMVIQGANDPTVKRAEAFFGKYLKGRFQEGGTPEVVQRLREITVDPRTVVLAR